MKCKTEYFFCSQKLLHNVDEINEIYSSIEGIEWKENYTITVEGKNYEHQRAYNKSFQLILSRLGSRARAEPRVQWRRISIVVNSI